MLAATYVSDPVIKAAGVRALLLHPGWVQTSMGNAGGRSAPVTVEESVAGLITQIMRGVDVQLAPPSAAQGYAIGSFEQLLETSRLVFSSYDGEILPF